ncbi:response regulator [Sulfurimonas sp.]|uniref:response regulator n=1 Tax=Sulfurimonas sp. TaxID=2022749 RepID=UPI003565F717
MSFLDRLTLNAKLNLLILMTTLSILIITAVSFYIRLEDRDTVDHIYKNHVTPLVTLEEIKDIYNINILDTINEERLGNISKEDAFEVLKLAKEILGKKWNQFGLKEMDDDEKELFAYSKREYVKIINILRADEHASEKKYAQNILELKDIISHANIELNEYIKFQLELAYKEKLRSDHKYMKFIVYASFFILLMAALFYLFSLKIKNNIKTLSNELIEAKEIAEDSVKSKSKFLASMSHDIRTPMNGVIGMLGLLMNSKLDDTQRHQATLAQSSAKALLSLINDILDFSKVEAGKMDLEYIDFNIRDELGDFAESIAFRAQEKGVELVLDVTDIDRSIINADPGRIRQILSNIVGNSIKFTSQGFISIKATLNPINYTDARLIIEMSDSGIGIPEDKIATLFDSFSQVDASTTRKYGGTGLGLAIVQKLIDLMDGKIDVKSDFGKGSIFSIDIAVNLSQNTSLAVPKTFVKDKKVLIIDSSKLSIGVIQKQLEHWGMKIDSATNSKEALLKLEEGNFDITFIDMVMPTMKGEELAEIIRNNPKYDKIKIIIMTSLIDRGDAPHYADIGIDRFFPKPATTKDLFSALATLSATQETIDVASAEKDENEPTFEKNILLVEDNLTNQLVANGMLEDFGLEADIANNGIEALDILNKSNKKYDLIFMDCQMPELDGYDTTKAIRAEEAGDIYTKIPIVAMTANAMHGDQEKCKSAGMSDYLAKPIDRELLKNILIKWL